MNPINPGKAPTTDAEWAREVSRRLGQLEATTTARVGPWVISSVDGVLRADSPEGGTLILGSPESVDADAVQEIVRSSGFATTKQVDAVQSNVDDVAGDVASQGNSITNIFEDLTDLFSGFGSQQAEIDAVIARLDGVEAAFSVTPAYVADVEDVATCSRQNLVGWSASSGSAAGASGTGSATVSKTPSSHSHTILGSPSHSHSVSMSVYCPRYSPDKLNLSSTSYVEYTPMIVDRKGHPGVLRWICGADGLFGVDAYYMALCAYNPSNGQIEKVWDSGDIKGSTDYSAPTEVEFDMGIADQLVVPGQLLFAAHQQIAPGLAQSTRGFAAAPYADIARPSTLLLNAPSYRTPSRVGSIPSTIAKSNLVPINTRIPWIAMSVSPAA